MSMTINFGWWLVPLAITIASFVLAVWVLDDESLAMGGIFITAPAAIIVSLIAWVVWLVWSWLA